jgi:hypothetical protein
MNRLKQEIIAWETKHGERNMQMRRRFNALLAGGDSDSDSDSDDDDDYFAHMKAPKKRRKLSETPSLAVAAAPPSSGRKLRSRAPKKDIWRVESDSDSDDDDDDIDFSMFKGAEDGHLSNAKERYIRENNMSAAEKEAVIVRERLYKALRGNDRVTVDRIIFSDSPPFLGDPSLALLSQTDDPLYMAIWQGNERVVRRLLQLDVPRMLFHLYLAMRMCCAEKYPTMLKPVTPEERKRWPDVPFSSRRGVLDAFRKYGFRLDRYEAEFGVKPDLMAFWFNSAHYGGMYAVSKRNPYDLKLVRVKETGHAMEQNVVYKRFYDLDTHFEIW